MSLVPLQFVPVFSTSRRLKSSARECPGRYRVKRRTRFKNYIFACRLTGWWPAVGRMWPAVGRMLVLAALLLAPTSVTSSAPPCAVSLLLCVFSDRCVCVYVSWRSSSLECSVVCVCAAALCVCRVPDAGGSPWVDSAPVCVFVLSRMVDGRGSLPPRSL